ncbi:MAG TPA: ABC transporter ATP-binding protein [Terriglobales bacterium]|nr:ABC transporter ATP-binding protein [Terriglobales bacterium]
MPVVTSPALDFQNIRKEYRTFWGRDRHTALHDFSLTIQPGEIFGFLGPNGAGKTTAIHIALGLMAATSGRGTLLDRPFGHARTRRRVGFLPENIAFYHRPAEALVRIYGRLNAIAEPELARRTKDLLDSLELRDVANKSVSKFSRGMLQRVGLAQALVNDPELLILDEPTSALDTAGRVAVRELLLHARRQGKTIFLSSHLLSEVEVICDRIGILHKGRLLRQGTVADLLESRAECEIVARGITAQTFPAAEVKDGLSTLRVSANDQRATIERIWASGGEVISVSPRKRSLEDVFLGLTQQDPVTQNTQDEEARP